MIHLTDKVQEIAATLRKEGFKGIRFDGVDADDHSELGDFDGDTVEHEYYRRDHGSFIAFPRFPCFDIEEDDYTEAPSFNQSKFIADLVSWIREQVGEDVGVSYSGGCGEFECYRMVK